MATTITLPSVKRGSQYGGREHYVRLIHKNKELQGHFETPTGQIYDEEFRQAALHSIQAYELLRRLCEKYPL